jgi:hypothetical protein
MNKHINKNNSVNKNIDFNGPCLYKIRLRPNSKLPDYQEKNELYKQSSANIPEGCGVGFKMGIQTMGMFAFAIDLDTKDTAVHDYLRERYGTYEQNTHRGNHFVFMAPYPMANERIPGLGDVKGLGGFIVGSGTTIKLEDGSFFTYTDNNATIVSLTLEDIDEMRKKTGAKLRFAIHQKTSGFKTRKLLAEKGIGVYPSRSEKEGAIVMTAIREGLSKEYLKSLWLFSPYYGFAHATDKEREYPSKYKEQGESWFNYEWISAEQKLGNELIIGTKVQPLFNKMFDEMYKNKELTSAGLIINKLTIDHAVRNGQVKVNRSPFGDEINIITVTGNKKLGALFGSHKTTVKNSLNALANKGIMTTIEHHNFSKASKVSFNISVDLDSLILDEKLYQFNKENKGKTIALEDAYRGPRGKSFYRLTKAIEQGYVTPKELKEFTNLCSPSIYNNLNILASKDIIKKNKHKNQDGSTFTVSINKSSKDMASILNTTGVAFRTYLKYIVERQLRITFNKFRMTSKLLDTLLNCQIVVKGLSKELVMVYAMVMQLKELLLGSPRFKFA